MFIGRNLNNLKCKTKNFSAIYNSYVLIITDRRRDTTGI